MAGCTDPTRKRARARAALTLWAAPVARSSSFRSAGAAFGAEGLHQRLVSPRIVLTLLARGLHAPRIGLTLLARGLYALTRRLPLPLPESPPRARAQPSPSPVSPAFTTQTRSLHSFTSHRKKLEDKTRDEKGLLILDLKKSFGDDLYYISVSPQALAFLWPAMGRRCHRAASLRSASSQPHTATRALPTHPIAVRRVGDVR
jgi:hypothetical protein